MTTAYITHNDCLGHLMPEGHPEQVARLATIHKALSRKTFDGLQRSDAPMADDDAILRCHPKSHLDRVRAARPNSGFAALDPDTYMSPGTFDAAMRGVGGTLLAVDVVMRGDVANAFVACRPPGHHAETAKPMGFCLFGNVAIAAKYALDRHGLKRVAIIDFDVHHGNGTQDLLWSEPRSLFCSTHQMPLYPGTGAPAETGEYDTIMNHPLGARSGGHEMRSVYENRIFPAIERFKPELILISAGFDAHVSDPLAQLNWKTEDFAWLTRRICDLADKICNGRVVSTLEGGYDLDALGESVSVHVQEMMESG